MASAFSLLAIAFVLFMAVKLIEAVLPFLLVTAGLGIVVAICVTVMRARNRGW